MYISILLILYPFLTRWFDEPEGTGVAHEARAVGSSNEKMLLQKHLFSAQSIPILNGECIFMHGPLFQQAMLVWTECTFKTAWLSCPTSEACAVVIPKTQNPLCDIIPAKSGPKL